jgi:hypothetical protein
MATGQLQLRKHVGHVGLVVTSHARLELEKSGFESRRSSCSELMRNVSSVGPVCSINCVNVRYWPTALTAIRGLTYKELSTRPAICLLLPRTPSVQPVQSPLFFPRRLKLAALMTPQQSRARRCMYVALWLTWPHPACY